MHTQHTDVDNNLKWYLPKISYTHFISSL